MATVAKPAKELVRAREGAKPVIEAEPTIEQIRQRAYQLYLFRGEGSCGSLEDWPDDERELHAKSS